MTANSKDTTSNWVDPDDALEWSGDVFDRAEIRVGGAVVREAGGTLTRRGRPRLEHPKRQVTLRLDASVVERFKAGGPGWQSRINDILRKAAGV